MKVKILFDADAKFTAKAKIFMRRVGEAAGESGNFHETNVGLLAEVKIFLRRVGLLKKAGVYVEN